MLNCKNKRYIRWPFVRLALLGRWHHAPLTLTLFFSILARITANYRESSRKRKTGQMAGLAGLDSDRAVKTQEFERMNRIYRMEGDAKGRFIIW